MTPPPVRIPFNKVETLVASGNSGLTAIELRMFVQKGVLRPETAQVALDALESSCSTEGNTQQPAYSARFNGSATSNPLSFRSISSSSTPSLSSLEVAVRCTPPAMTGGTTTWYSSFLQEIPSSEVSSPRGDKRIFRPDTTQAGPSSSSSNSTPGDFQAEESSVSDQISLDTECDSRSGLIHDRDIGSSSSRQFQHLGMYYQNLAHAITSPTPSFISLFTDARTLQKRNKRKADSPMRSPSSPAELQDHSPGVRFKIPFADPTLDQGPLPSIAESNEEDTSSPASSGGSNQAADNETSRSRRILGDSGLGSEVCSPDSRLRTREASAGRLSTRVSDLTTDELHLRLPPSLVSQRLQLAQQHFANSGAAQVLPPPSASLIVPGDGAHIFEYPLLLPEIRQASKERVWKTGDLEGGQRNGRPAKDHGGKRVRVGNNASSHANASSQYIPEINSPYLSRRSSRLSSDSLHNRNEGLPLMGSFTSAHPVDAAPVIAVSVDTAVKQSNSYKHSLEFIVNSAESLNKGPSSTFANEMGLGEGAGSSTGPHVPTERKRKGVKSSSGGVRKYPQKIPFSIKSIVMSSTASAAKKVVKKPVRTGITEPDSSTRTAGTLDKKSSLKPTDDPVMVYFKINSNGGWYVRTKDNLMDPPLECSAINPAGDGSDKRTGPMIDSAQGSSSSFSAPPSYRLKPHHNNNSASKASGSSVASASTSSRFSSIFASGKTQTATSFADTKLKFSVTTASAFAASNAASTSSNVGSKMKRVILGDGSLPSSASGTTTLSPAFQRIKVSSKANKAGDIAEDRVSLASAASGSSSPFQFNTLNGSPKRNRTSLSAERPAAAFGTQGSFSSFPSPGVVHSTLVRADAFSPGSIYRSPPGLRQGDGGASFAGIAAIADRECGSCEHKEEKFWRYGLKENSFLCNACGLRFRKTLVHCANVETCAYIPTLSELDRMERERTRMKLDSARCLNCRGPVTMYK